MIGSLGAPGKDLNCSQPRYQVFASKGHVPGGMFLPSISVERFLARVNHMFSLY